MDAIPFDCPCAGAYLKPSFQYTARPEGETVFALDAGKPYRRGYQRCSLCDHFVATHQMDLSALYAHDYVTSTYGDADGLRRAYDRINALPPERSDNVGRVRRILDFAAGYLRRPAQEERQPTLLDVGSGLAVFPYRMKQAGWACTALDTDARLVAHAQAAAGVLAVCGYLGDAEGLGRYDVVTFNKVLEHVKDPTALLALSKDYLAPGGFVYVEVPDGVGAAADGAGREEFFIEHLHVFSAASLALMARRAGFAVLHLAALQEPSTKHTLYTMLQYAHKESPEA